MSNGVKNLIDAIESGNSMAIDTAFNTELSTRISDKLDGMRQDLAQSMFKEQYEELDEASYEIKHQAPHYDAGEVDHKKHVDMMVKRAVKSGLSAKVKDYKDSEGNATIQLKHNDHKKVHNWIKKNKHSDEIGGGSDYEINKLRTEDYSIEDYSIEDIQDFMQSEDFNQLDELSKGTLSSYLDKAKKDKKDTHAYKDTIDKERASAYWDGTDDDYKRELGKSSRAANAVIKRRTKGINTATKKNGMKEQYEEYEEYSTFEDEDMFIEDLEYTTEELHPALNDKKFMDADHDPKTRKEIERDIKNHIKHHTSQRDHGMFAANSSDSLKKHQAKHQAEIDRGQHHLNVSAARRKKDLDNFRATGGASAETQSAIKAGTRHIASADSKEHHDKIMAHVKAHNDSIPHGQRAEHGLRTSRNARAGGKFKIYIDGKKEHVDKIKSTLANK